MPKAVYAALDWFIPNASKGERSEIGHARSFIVTHLLGPVLIQSIVVLTLMADPHPSIACWAMMACVAGFWVLPFGLRATGDLQLMALISIELLCVMSLIGSSFYGGVTSPFLPWLLVSLMLGFFYLSDHTIRVLTLFGSNIVAMVGVHLVYEFPQHLSPADLGAISWFSMFSATAYMSLMAIYYAGILSMRSELERETERHRLMAHRLRSAKRKADAASHGKAVILAKMKQQFEAPLSQIVTRSRALIAEQQGGGFEPRSGELPRIHETGRQLLALVHDAVDQNRDAPPDGADQDVAICGLLDTIVAVARKLAPPPSEVTVAELPRDLGRMRVDARKLRQVCESVLGKAVASGSPSTIRLEALRHRRSTGDWIEIRIGILPRPAGPAPLNSIPRVVDIARLEADLEMDQLRCAVIGGTLTATAEPNAALRFVIELPAAPIETWMPMPATEALRKAS